MSEQTENVMFLMIYFIEIVNYSIEYGAVIIPPFAEDFYRIILLLIRPD